MERGKRRRFWSNALGAALALSAAPHAGKAEILWSGDYETGNFLQWHRVEDKSEPFFAGVPQHGRPRDFGSGGASKGRATQGSLLEVVTNPVRQGRYAAKFTVLNSASGAEPRDCDSGGSACNRRRTELWAHRILPEIYNAIPYQSERWLSISHYVPHDWETGGGSWGPIVYQLKPFNDGGGRGPCFSIMIKDHGWLLDHRWTDKRDLREVLPWRQHVEYTSKFPSRNGGDDGQDLRADFPDQQLSQTALANLNKGGWTDWVIHVKFDARSSAAGGQGFLTVWKRAGNEDWIKVLHVEPRRITRRGRSYDRGICYNSPANGSNPGGFGVLAGLYMSKKQVWDLSRNRVIYNDNVKVASAEAGFAAMSPDGSTPWSVGGGETSPIARPRAPRLVIEGGSPEEARN